MDVINDAGLLSPRPDRTSATGSEALTRLTVSGFLDAVGSAIRLKLPHTILLTGQILKVVDKNWGWTFDLIDPQADSTAAAARVSGKVDRRTLVRIGDELGFALRPEMLEGSVIVAQVKTEWHKRYGLEVKLVGLDPAITAGLVAGRLEAIRAALIASAVHDAQRRLPVPETILRIGLIAPATSASLSDVMVELERWRDRGIIKEIVHIPATFEGARAPKSLTEAFLNARFRARQHEIDVVLVVRGGGDAAGLAASVDERVARAMLSVPVPVIVGLGHARDQHLLDELAWRAAGTPSKALGELWRIIVEPARAAMRDWHGIRSATNRAIASDHAPELERRRDALVDAALATLRNAEAELSGYRHVVAHRGSAVLAELHVLGRDLDRDAEAIRWDASAWPGREDGRLQDLYRAVTAGARENLDRLDTLADGQIAVASALLDLFRRQGDELIRTMQGVEANARRILLEATSNLHEANAALQALDADGALDAGYVLAVRPDGTIIKGTAAACQADMFSLIFKDGVVAVAPLKSTTDATVH